MCYCHNYTATECKCLFWCASFAPREDGASPRTADISGTMKRASLVVLRRVLLPTGFIPQSVTAKYCRELIRTLAHTIDNVVRVACVSCVCVCVCTLIDTIQAARVGFVVGELPPSPPSLRRINNAPTRLRAIDVVLINVDMCVCVEIDPKQKRRV